MEKDNSYFIVASLAYSLHKPMANRPQQISCVGHTLLFCRGLGMAHGRQAEAASLSPTARAQTTTQVFKLQSHVNQPQPCVVSLP
jgi:hypothetical protein